MLFIMRSNDELNHHVHNLEFKPVVDFTRGCKSKIDKFCKTFVNHMQIEKMSK